MTTDTTDMEEGTTNTVESKDNTNEGGNPSLKDEIKVINDLMPIQPEVVPPQDTTSGGNGNDDNDNDMIRQIQRTVNGAMKSTTGAIDEHVVQKTKRTLDHVGQSTRTHIGATKDAFQNMQKNTQVTMEDVKQNSKKKWDDSIQHGKNTIEDVKQNSKKTWDDSIQHGKNTIEDVKQNSQKKWDDSIQHGKNTMEDVKQNSQKKWDDSIQHGKNTMEDVKQNSQKKWDDSIQHGKHTLDGMQKNTKSMIESATKKGQETWNDSVEHRRVMSFFLGTAPSLACTNATNDTLQLAEGLFRSFGQVIFCNNPVTGVFVWLAMLVSLPLSGVCATFCVLAVNMTATHCLMLDVSLVRNGMYGYNAVLVGAGIATLLDFSDHGYFMWSVSTSILVSILAAPCVLVVYLFMVHAVSSPSTIYVALHVPYNCIMVALFLSASLIDFGWLKGGNDEASTQDTGFLFVPSLVNGVSQMIMSKNVLSGALLAGGIVLCSPIRLVAALAGSLVANLLALGFVAVPHSIINSGSIGYNAAFTVAFLSMRFAPSARALVVILFAAVVTMVVETAMLSTLYLPTLTIPFCLATFPFLALDADTLCLVPADALSDGEAHSLVADGDALSIPEAPSVQTYGACTVSGETVDDVETGDVGSTTMSFTEETPLIRNEEE